MLRRAAVLLLIWHSGHANADGFELEPAEAEYRVVLAGVPLGMDATIRLEAGDVPSAYALSFLLEHRLVRHSEVSRFVWHDCQARPDHYEYASAGFGISRGGSVAFHWDEQVAETAQSRFDLPAGTVDALTLTQAARCLMRDRVDEMRFQVMEPTGLEEKAFRILGMEVIETPAGTFDALKVERIYPEGGRRTLLWAAPALNWFLVRMEHVENPVVRGRMELTRFTSLVEAPRVGTR